MPGRSYNISVWVKADAGTTAQMQLWLHNATGTTSHFFSTAFTPGTGWQKVSLTYVADDSTAVRIHLHYLAGSGTIYYDDARIEQVNSGISTTRLFTGFERDAESALDHTWFRKYSSAQARWLSPDPLGGSIFNPQSLNRYSYVLNDPINFIDPLGLFCTPPEGPGERGQCIEPTKMNVSGSGSVVYTLANGGTVIGVWNPGHETESSFIPGYWSFFLIPGDPQGPVHPPGWLDELAKKVKGFFQSARLPGESVSSCVDRTQKALLGQNGQTALHLASGLSLFTGVPTFSQGPVQLVPGAAADLLPRVGQTVGQARPTVLVSTQLRGVSIAERIVAHGVASGEIAGAGAIGATRSIAAVVGKASVITFAIGLGLEGGFVLACR